VIKKLAKVIIFNDKKLNIGMKKPIYESFVRSHILYGIIIWGRGEPLEKMLSKIWSKIGTRKKHTVNRLKEYGMLKLEDELAIQEIKFVWKWEKRNYLQVWSQC
jgi:hypothetical protein